MKKGLSKFDTYAIVIGTAGIGYLTYRIIKKTKENRASKKSKQEQEAEYKQFSTKEKLSFTATSYQNLAKRIYNAFEQNYGVYNSLFDSVNEKEIYAVFDKLKNNLDYLELKKAFGVKPIPTAFFRLVTDPVDMETWLTNALSTSERAQLNKILKTKGIVIEI
jgi:ribosomal protein L9